jgi:hypothetical protein
LQHFRSQNKVTREAVHYHSDCNHVTTDLRPLFFPSQLPPFNLSQRAPVLFWIFLLVFTKICLLSPSFKILACLTLISTDLPQPPRFFFSF